MKELSLETLFYKYTDNFTDFYTKQTNMLFSPSGYKYELDFAYLKSYQLKFDDSNILKDLDINKKNELYIKELTLNFSKFVQSPLVQNFDRLLSYSKFSNINFIFRLASTGLFIDKSEIDHIEINGIKIYNINFISGDFYNTIKFKNLKKLKNNVLKHIIEKINTREKLEIIFYGSKRSEKRKTLEQDFMFGGSSLILTELTKKVKTRLTTFLNDPKSKYYNQSSVKIISKTLFNKEIDYNVDDIQTLNCHKLMESHNFKDVQELFCFLIDCKVFNSFKNVCVPYIYFKRIYQIN